MRTILQSRNMRLARCAYGRILATRLSLLAAKNRCKTLMTVEIELKFIATPAAIAELPAQLARFNSEHTAPLKLTNIYFETAENYLRSHDIGLRIRGFDDQYEMTIKTGGKVLAGLHQRPEYNVELKKPDR